MTQTALEVRCPAKINLTLRIVGELPGGFHELDTIFQTVDLWDVIQIEPASELKLSCSGVS